jgi:lactaldehyde dehydrogenase/glycolaldehyde dehydrogenase
MNSSANKFTDYQCFISGQWAGPENGETITVDNPANGQVIATVPACSTAQAIEALDGAERAQPNWQALPPIERAGYLYRIADGLREQRDHFARLLVLEKGKPGLQPDDACRPESANRHNLHQQRNLWVHSGLPQWPQTQRARR